MYARVRNPRFFVLIAALPTCIVLAGPNTAWAQNGTWSSTADLTVIQGQNTATKLQDGRVLVVGQDRFGHMAAEIYDPASATWTRQANPIRQRYGFTATPLPDGRVLIVGGDAFGSNTSEAFDPSSGTWTATANLNGPRVNGRVAALADGRVLLAGGARPPSVDPLQDAEIYDPANDTWTVTGSMVVALPWFTMATLQDGTVLASGGGYDNITSEVYDPIAGTWSQSGDVAGANQGFTLTVLADGRAFAVGGTGTHHLYDPVSRTWRVTAAPGVTAPYTTSTLVQNGTVLLAGTDYCCSASSAVFDPSSETWQLTGNMVQRPRQHHSAVLLNDGTVLSVGGYYEGPPCDEGTCTVYALKSAEVFTPQG